MIARVDTSAVKHRLADPLDVARRLRLVDGAIRQGGGLTVRCPAHGDRTASCSLTRGADRTLRVRCFACDLAGDIFDLVAAVEGLDRWRDFRRVAELAAELAGVDIEVNDTRTSRSMPRAITRAPDAPLEREYPPLEEVADLWGSSRMVGDDRDVAAYLERRGLDVAEVESRDLARALPASGALPVWARFKGASWRSSGHRMIVQAIDSAGVARSLRASIVLEGESPKRLAPAGYSASGLIFADAGARRMLAGDVATLPDRPRLVIAEGEPDWLTWATRTSSSDEDAPIVIGLFSGSWSTAFAASIPSSARVVVRTHADEAGDRYAMSVVRSLVGRVELLRGAA